MSINVAGEAHSASASITPAEPRGSVFGGHMPALDGVRGLAVLMVLLTHFVAAATPTNLLETVLVAATNYGALGVELFFVLSGFLITGILYDTRDQPHYFRNFFMRRVLRIFPLYFGVLVLVFLVAPLIPHLRGPTLDFLVDRQIWAWLYSVNFYIAKEGAWAYSYLNHFWSLCVEEHFYLFWPLVVFLFAQRPRLLVAVCLATAALALLGRLTGIFMGLSWWTTYVFTPFRLDGLALGAFMAVAIRQAGGRNRMVAALPRVAVIAVVLLLATYALKRMVSGRDGDLILTLRAGIVQVLLACLVLRAVTAPQGTLIGQFFTSRFMMFLGTYSYGLYVYHHFISYYFTSNKIEFAVTDWLGSHTLAMFLMAVGGMSASMAIAYLSYEYFEKRFLAMKRHFEAHKPRTTLPAGAKPELS